MQERVAVIVAGLREAAGFALAGGAVLIVRGEVEREADPDGVLPPTERARRAQAARRAYFTGLALRSARARHCRD